MAGPQGPDQTGAVIVGPLRGPHVDVALHVREHLVERGPRAEDGVALLHGDGVLLPELALGVVQLLHRGRCAGQSAGPVLYLGGESLRAHRGLPFPSTPLFGAPFLNDIPAVASPPADLPQTSGQTLQLNVCTGLDGAGSRPSCVPRRRRSVALQIESLEVARRVCCRSRDAPVTRARAGSLCCSAQESSAQENGNLTSRPLALTVTRYPRHWAPKPGGGVRAGLRKTQ